MSAREVTLVGGSPWGFRMHGGHDLHQPLRISRVNPGSKAAQQSVREGDLISSINGRSTRELTNSEAHALLRNAGERLKLGLNQENVGSPKRRIYKSSLQENTSTEILSKTTTKTTTTSSTRIISGESRSSGANEPKHDRSYANQNGGPKKTVTREETGKGVWSPGSEPLPPSPPPTKEPSQGSEQRDAADKEGIPPVWTPSSTGASPVPERKEFRPVPFESPVLGRKKLPSQPEESTARETPPPWDEDEAKKQSYDGTSRIVNSHSAPAQGLNAFTSAPRLPRAQNPTITLLQKAREGQLPKGAAYLDESEIPKRPTSDEKPLISPGEIIYTLKKEYESEPESENEPPKKMADLGPRKFEGIGPTTKEGVPLVLRSAVKENNQAKWYRQMYNSLHRTDDKKDDYVTIRYKPRRGEYIHVFVRIRGFHDFHG